MQTVRRKFLCFVMIAGCTYLLIGASFLLAQDDCKVMEKAVADAFSKIHKTPSHVYTTATIGAQTFYSESIYADGSIYIKMNGKWTQSSSIKSAEQITEQNKHADPNSKDTCYGPKDAPLDGQTTVFYRSHSETDKGKVDLQIWISRTKGVLLRQDTDSEGGTVVISSRYEYDNVKKPHVRGFHF
jgi:hypothetical protein